MGFPIALLIAWASEIKTKGLGEDSIASASENAQLDGRSLNKNFWLFASISVALVGLFAFYVSVALIKPNTTSATRPQASPDLPSAPVLNFELVLIVRFSDYLHYLLDLLCLYSHVFFDLV